MNKITPPPHKLSLPGFLFVFILLLISNSCARYDVITKSNPINVSETRAWLQKNGMAYKNETISVQATNGALLTGKLNWRKARQYNWEGRDYVDVPFEFETKVESEGTKSQFAMVIRHGDEEAFEAALRVITYNPEAENLIKGDSNSLYAQTYEQLDGTPANAWVADNAGGKAISANRVFFTPDQIAQLRASVKASGKDKTLPRSAGGDCRLDVMYTYSGNCNYWGGETLGVVVRLCRNSTYLMTCGGLVGGGGGGFRGVPVPKTPTPVTPPYPPGVIDEFKEVDDEDREPEEDPCAEAKEGAEKASKLSKEAKCDTAKAEIQSLFALDGKEHAVSFGKDSDGKIIKSTPSTGKGHSAPVPNISEQFADIHNHTNNKPPSSGDIYGFIDLAVSKGSGYQRFITLPNGTVYTLIVTDIDAAKKFNTDYPREGGKDGYEPSFPESMVNEYYDLIQQQKGLYGKTPQEANEIAITYILNKYNAGVALLTQDTNGDFKRLNTEYNTNANATENPYTITKCQ